MVLPQKVMNVSSINKLLLRKNSTKNSENHYQNGYLNRCKCGDRKVMRGTAKTSKTQDKLDQVSSVLMNENNYFLSANWLALNLLFGVSLTRPTLSFAFYFFFDSKVTGPLVTMLYLQARRDTLGIFI